MLKDRFAGRTPAVRRCRGRQRFPVGADSISARGGSRRQALSSGRGPGMPGPYRVAIVPGGMTFLRTSAIAGKFAVRHCRGRRPPTPRGGVRAPRPTYKPQKGRQRFPVGADSISARGGSRRQALSSGRGPGMPGPYRDAAIFCASHKKIPHRPEQRTMGAKRNKQTAKKAQSKTPKRRRSLLLAGTAPERQTAG